MKNSVLYLELHVELMADIRVLIFILKITRTGYNMKKWFNFNKLVKGETFV